MRIADLTLYEPEWCYTDQTPMETPSPPSAEHAAPARPRPAPRQRRARRFRRSRERGLALVAVLWGLALLAIIAAGFSFETRTGTRVAQNIVENAKAEALADAAVYRAMDVLLDGVPENDPFADGRGYRLVFGGGEVAVSLQDTTGRIDLNRASDELLAGLFESVGVDAKATAALVDAIADFRDPDDERRPNGAEDRDYRAAGLNYGAKDGPFEAVEELQQVFGMTADLYQLVAPALTVQSRRPGVNPAYASYLVLNAIPGMNSGDLSAFLEARARAGWGRSQAVPVEVSGGGDEFSGFGEDFTAEDPAPEADLGGGAEGASSGMEALVGAVPRGNGVDRFYSFGASRFIYLIRAEATTQSGGVFVREATVRVSGRRGQPFIIMSWRQGERSAPPPAR
jgi:general secretion pathway protein K